MVLWNMIICNQSKLQMASREEAQPEELYAQDDVAGHFPSHTRPNVQLHGSSNPKLVNIIK